MTRRVMRHGGGPGRGGLTATLARRPGRTAPRASRFETGAHRRTLPGAPGPLRTALPWALTAVLVAGVGPAGAAAQEPGARGDRVRVSQGPWIPEPWRDTSEEWLRGRLQALTGDTLVVVPRDGVTVRIPVFAPDLVEVGRVVGHHARRGAYIGGGIGLGVGAALVGLSGVGDQPLDQDEAFLDDDQIATLALSTLGGALLGALLGSAVEDVEWRPLDRDAEVTALLAPGPGLGVRIPVGRR